MKTFKIEKGLKLPPPSRPASGGTISRAAQTMLVLEAGDSFLVADEREAFRAEKSMRDMNGTGRRRRGGKRFASRRLPAGLRIWRLR